MVKIRLRRMGKTKQPTYRIVVADSRSPRDGKFIEIIGHYNPIRQPKVLEVKHDRARYWLGVGAQMSDTVVHLFKKVQILDSDGKVMPATVEVEAPGLVAIAPPAAPPLAEVAIVPPATPQLADEDEDNDGLAVVSSGISDSSIS